MSKRTDRETEQKIIEAYQAGLSMAKVGALFNTTGATVLRILNSYNIPKRTKGGIYALPKQEIIERYQNGETCQSIADSFNVTINTICNLLEKNHIARDNKYQNLSLDENYFQTIDRNDKAYFLGFMLTDGNVGLQDNQIRLSLSVKDEEILHIFNQKTGNSNKILIRQDSRHDERTFQLKNQKWKEDLAKYTVTPQKTATCQMPQLSDDMMPHLIRGMLDGDGWISYFSHQIGFCGNQQTVQQLRDYLVKTLNVYNVKILFTKSNIYQITWGSLSDINKIGNYIYTNKEDCYLPRKYNNFLKITQGNTEVTN